MSLRRSIRLVRLAALALAFVHGASAHADAGWLEAGDVRLQMDLQLLNDAEVIRLPLSQWPLPRAAVQYALAHANDHFALNAAVAASLERVRARVAPAGSLSFDAGLRGGEPGLWRDFDTLAREEAELTAGVQQTGERFAFGLRATGAANPVDGRELRMDGSHATVHLGNWLLSAGTQDRWWGPGHEGSLILSNNARPMPTVMVERAEARPFETPWLSWLGPWRFHFGISQMEGERQDIDRPLFMAWRVTIMPTRNMEIGFSRTAQFCGEQLECSLEVFGNLLVGNDNVGIDATEENEPGNQMAGFDIRWNSPIGNLPYAVYSQYIGEDESSYLPAKYLAQIGLESWKPFADGGLLRWHVEYSSTTCSANTSHGPYYGCAYNQGLFNVEGYRYFGRSIGYTADRDAENYALGASFVEAGGNVWSATARRSRLNRDEPDPRNTVAAERTDYAALELGWKGRMFGQQFAIDLGVESIEPVGGERDMQAFGFLGWQHQFQP